ncbi:MAG: cobalt transporter [Oscillospiraceae bacterium]|nr:cobalt transporter [Oscillospiraceae bacterium]
MHEGHEHTHHGDDLGFETVAQAVALMTYMLEHNRHHAEELHELCHKLEAMGKGEAANLLDASVDDFRAGNAMLESALDILKGEG